MENGAAKNMEVIGYNDLEGRPSLKIAMQVVNDRWYVYTAHFWSPGWSIVDVTDPTKPEYVQHVPGPANTETCQVQVADNLMVTNLERMIPLPGRADTSDQPNEEGIYIWDVKDPVHPKRLGHFKTGGGGTHRNYWDGGRYVHLSASVRGFKGNIYLIVDIADPANPVEVGRWWLPEQWEAGGANWTKPRVHFHGPAYIVGDRAYLGYGGGGMVILDIFDLTLPRLVSSLEFSPPFNDRLPCHTVLPLPKRKLALVDSEAIAEECQEPLNIAGIVDISDEEKPRLISLLPLPEPPPGVPYKNFGEKGGRFGPHNFHQAQNQPHFENRDDRIYLTYFNAGLRIYDISDPYLPKEIAYFVPPDPKEKIGILPRNKLAVQSEDVIVDTRGYIYMTHKNQGVYILRCTV